MHEPNYLQKLKLKRVNTLNKFLKKVTKRNFSKMFEHEVYGTKCFVFIDDLNLNFLKLAVTRNYLIGVSLVAPKDGRTRILIDSPVITPEGEVYLDSQRFFSRNPIIEKLIFVILTGLVSALATYLASPPPAP